MNCRLSVVLAGLLLVVLSVAAHAQLIETAMRGNTVVASPGLTTAWAYNPAALASLAGMTSDDPEASRGDWSYALSAELELSGDSDLFGVNWGGNQLGRSFGLGAGYIDMFDSKHMGVGFGKAWPAKNIAWGVTWQNWDMPGGDSENLFDTGVIGKLSIGEQFGDARFGVVMRDVTDQFARTWDVGASATLPSGVLVAADISDLTDEYDSTVRIGASKRFGVDNQWLAGAGLDDGNLTFGAMYDSAKTNWKGGSWRFGAAWQDMDSGSDSLIVGAFATWGLK